MAGWLGSWVDHLRLPTSTTTQEAELTSHSLAYPSLCCRLAGAGGLDLILGPKTVRGMRLGEGPEGAGAPGSQIKGIGGSGDKPATRRCQLAEVRMGSCTFHPVQALYHPPRSSSGKGGGGGLELSQYTSGILCGGLLGRCHLVFDFPRMRVAVQGLQQR